MTYYPIAYAYQADIICPDCIVGLLETRYGITTHYLGDVELQLAHIASDLGIDVDDETTYDSYDFPKVIFDYDFNDAEICGNCFQPIE